MDDVIRTEGPHQCTITVYKSEDWVDAVPQLVDEEGNPFDITACSFDLFIRPSGDFSPPITHLTSSSGGGGIEIESGPLGLLLINVAQGDLDEWPLGHWFQFLNMTFTDPDLGAVTKTIWRGPCDILPGRTEES